VGAGDEEGEGEEPSGGDFSPGKDVNRGRIYERVDGAGAGGGDGGRGGGNQLCNDKRAKSAETSRCSVRSALEPTM
jgi:hypothetical protein